MNGAEALIETLVAAGVDTCFANPGTSEMALVAAIDRVPGMRAVLGLFEGVVTGAADGYARMAGRPALTLLHLGPGVANGLANLHNARRARSPVLNMVGDHASDHLQFDAPLTSDLATLVRPMSDRVRRSRSARDLARAGLDSLAAAQRWPGQVASLIVPADHAWGEGGVPLPPPPPPLPRNVPPGAVEAAAAALRRAGDGIVLFLGGRATRAAALHEAGRIAAATGARLVAETFSARMERGAGRVGFEKLPYFGRLAQERLAGTRLLLLVGAEPPVAFFGYPGEEPRLWPAEAECLSLATADEDPLPALRALAGQLHAPAEPAGVQARTRQPVADGPLSPSNVAAILANLLPEGAIVADEGATAGLPAVELCATAAAHDWLQLTGGAIGQGLPLAVGAAIACPTRKVVALEADGSGLYTVQALWTMARERLDVVVILLNNRAYAVLRLELQRIGVQNPGPGALSLLQLGNPDIDWCRLAEGLGVAAERATTAAGFDASLKAAFGQRGPRLIEVVLQ